MFPPNEPELEATVSAPLDTPPSYSTADVARKLGVSIPTVQRWVDQGRLKAWKTMGGHRRIDAASAEALMAGQRPPKAMLAGTSRAAPSVLVVDDNPIDRDLLVALVESIWPQAKPLLADNGFQALLKVGGQPPDIVISDIVMPNMNGIEMLRQLSQWPGQSPSLLVAVSSLSPAQIERLGGLPPRVLFVAKPLEPELACAAIASAWQQVA